MMRLIIDFLVFYLILSNWSCLAEWVSNPDRLTSRRPPNSTRSEDRANLNTPPCHSSQIEYRLTKLEIQTAEKGESVKSELRENNRRLQALEWQIAEVETALEGLKSELSRFSGVGQISNEKSDAPDHDSEEIEELGQKLETLSSTIYVATAASKSNNVELKLLRQDIALIKNNTRKILTDYQQLLNKEFFNDALVDVKHRLNVRHASNYKCPTSNDDKPKDCIDLRNAGKPSGVYKVFPEEHPQGFMVLCEMEKNGGGWTVIQNRYDGSQDFYLSWHDYKHGFGNLGGEFWLGLDYIYYLTGHEVNELLIDLIDHTSTEKYAHYGAFSIGSELEGYSLKLLSNYEGDAGDSLTYHAGSRFSAKDMDQDGWDEGSCARSHSGAWWYKACDTSNLNGKYMNGELPESVIYQGMYWGGFRGAQYSLRQARMMVRPRDKAEKND